MTTPKRQSEPARLEQFLWIEVGPSQIALPPLARQRLEAKDWQDEWLKVLVLQAVAHQAYGEKDMAVQLLDDALALTVPGGFIRLFVDEGTSMAHLLLEAAAQGIMPDYIGKLLAVFEAEEQKSTGDSQLPPTQRLIEPTRVKSTKTHCPGTFK